MTHSTKIEVDAVEAMRMLDVPEEILGKIAEQEKLKSRCADGTRYFLKSDIEKIAARQVEEVRSTGFPSDELGENDAVQG